MSNIDYIEEEKRKLLKHIGEFLTNVTQSMKSVDNLWKNIIEYRNTITDAFTAKALQEEMKQWDYSVYKIWKDISDTCKEIVYILNLTLEELTIAKETKKFHRKVVQEISHLTKTFVEEFEAFETKSTGTVEGLKGNQYIEDVPLSTMRAQNIVLTTIKRPPFSFNITMPFAVLFGGLFTSTICMWEKYIAVERKPIVVNMCTIATIIGLVYFSFRHKKKGRDNINADIDNLTKEIIQMNQDLKEFGDFVIKKVGCLKIGYSESVNHDSIQNQIEMLLDSTKQLKCCFEFLLDEADKNLSNARQMVLKTNPTALLFD